MKFQVKFELLKWSYMQLNWSEIVRCPALFPKCDQEYATLRSSSQGLITSPQVTSLQGLPLHCCILSYRMMIDIKLCGYVCEWQKSVFMWQD